MIYSYDSNNHSGRQQFNEKKWKNSNSPRKQHDNDDPHMKSTPQFSLQSLSLFQQKGWSIKYYIIEILSSQL